MRRHIYPLLGVFVMVVMSTIVEAASPANGYLEANNSHLQYRDVIYSTTENLLIREVTDTNLKFISYEECILRNAAPEEKGEYRGRLIEECELISGFWLPANKFVVRELNRVFTSQLKRRIKEYNESIKMKGSDYLSQGLIEAGFGAAMILNGTRSHADAVRPRGAGLGLFMMGFAVWDVFMATVTYSDRIQPIEVALERTKQQLEIEDGAVEPHLPRIMYRLFRETLEEVLDKRGIERYSELIPKGSPKWVTRSRLVASVEWAFVRHPLLWVASPNVLAHGTSS